jgi:hypothetical protein
MRKLVFWMPLLFVGSMMYWTVAVGLGGLSLGALLPAMDMADRDIYQPIRVTFGRAGMTATGATADRTADGLSATSDSVEPGVDDGDLAMEGASSEAIQVEPETDQGGSGGPVVAVPAEPPTSGPTSGPGDTAF